VSRAGPRARRRAVPLGALAVLVSALAACGGERADGIKVTGGEVDTHQTVAAGQTVRITASGTVDFGGGVAGIGAQTLSADGDDGSTPPDSPAPHLRRNSLVVRIGDAYYQGGVEKAFVSATEGEVVLRANDATPADNSKVWDVRVDVGDRITTGGAVDPSGESPPANFEDLPVSGAPVRTGVYVAAGSSVHLTSTGIVDSGRPAAGAASPRVNADGNDGPAPLNYPAPNLRPNSLIVQIDGSLAWYQGGSEATFVPATSGMLLFATNDDDIRDNTQSWFVSGRITAPPAGPAPPTTFGPYIVNNTLIDTGLTVAAGQRIHVQARGRMNLGGGTNGRGDLIADADGDGPEIPTPPGYPAVDLRKNSLLVQIGSAYYQGGMSVDITAKQGGRVSLLANDILPQDNQSVLNGGLRGWYVTVTPR
jgi:hypothetical protein